MSGLAASMYATKMGNRYILPLRIGNKYFMPGRENLGNIVSVLNKKLCSIYKTEFAITKGLSGMHQMDIIMSALIKVTDKIIIMDNLNGGHSKTEGIAKKYGFHIANINLEFDNWDVDYKKLKLITDKWRNEKVFIYIDHTTTLNPLNINRLIKKIPTNWIVYYDISHLQLFYFSHIFNFPKYKNFFFGGSTHKTFPGPQKAIILLNNKDLYDLINTKFNKTTSSVHTGSLLALLITVIEMEKFGVEYAKDILDKTRYFAKLLSDELNLVGPLPYLTNTHQICIDVPNITEAIQNLASIGIITTPMKIPSTGRSGIRFGIQEQCRLGIKRGDLLLLSEIIVSCVNKNKIKINLENKVKKIAKKLTTVHYVLPHVHLR
jgi:glycine/serine hydroxymethyltransferase